MRRGESVSDARTERLREQQVRAPRTAMLEHGADVIVAIGAVGVSRDVTARAVTSARRGP